MLKTLILVILLVCTTTFAAKKGSQTTETLPAEIAKETKSINKQFLLFTPKTYSTDKSKPCPLIIFLHGMGERGEDLKLVKRHGPPKVVAKDKSLPFLIVSLQCLKGKKGSGMFKGGKGWWQTKDLNLVLKYLLKTLNVDKDRVYLTGLSMGGFGTWSWAAENPEHFAAIAPVCGGGNPMVGRKYGKLPIWAFHGDKDNVVPLRMSQAMVDAVVAAKGNAKLTVYPGVGHDSWNKAYNDKELYKWFLSHKRKSK